MSTLTLATCRDAHLYSPEPDDQLLQTALQEAGVSTELVAWDNPTYDWSRPNLAVIRSTWDYPASYEPFLAWVSSVARQTTLWNPVELVRWNAHKTYLRDLKRQGIPIIPTVWLPAQSQVRLPSLMQSTGWRQVVIKPVVGTSGRQARVIPACALEEGQAHLDTLLKSGEAMLQPFLPSFYATGERCLTFINGSFTHAIRKRFALVDGLDQVGQMPIEVEQEELAFATRVLQRLPVVPLFARVDLVRDPRHQLRLNELEVIEPVLYLSSCQQALHRLTDACLQLFQQAVKQRQHATIQGQEVTRASSGRDALIAEPGKPQEPSLLAPVS
jgi:glutathione synthase/RimK-type ligase-like ATP-grasp enzyme